MMVQTVPIYALVCLAACRTSLLSREMVVDTHPSLGVPSLRCILDSLYPLRVREVLIAGPAANWSNSIYLFPHPPSSWIFLRGVRETTLVLGHQSCTISSLIFLLPVPGAQFLCYGSAQYLRSAWPFIQKPPSRFYIFKIDFALLSAQLCRVRIDHSLVGSGIHDGETELP